MNGTLFLRTLVATTLLAFACAVAGCGDRTVRISPDAKVKIRDVRDGIGAKAEEGHLVHVHYVGRLEDGDEVINTYDNGRVHKFILGDKTVIPGMDLGVRGMRAGGKRVITMPPEAHYGRLGYADRIPEDATLVFEVELLRVRDRDGNRRERLYHPNDPRERLPL
jgi:peptidylprolyl isomerase